MGYSPWGHKESDTTEQLTLSCGCLRLGIGHCWTGGEPDHPTLRPFMLSTFVFFVTNLYVPITCPWLSH